MNFFEGYLTTEELAQSLAISPQTLAQWRSQGRGPPYLKFGGRVLYRIAAVQEWLAGKECYPGRGPSSSRRPFEGRAPGSKAL